MGRIFILAILLYAASGCKSQKAQTTTGAPEPVIIADEQAKIRYRLDPEEVAGGFHAGKDSLNFEIREAAFREDRLNVAVKYGGGCKTHEFKLVFPEQPAHDTLQLFLLHLPSGDPCRAFVMNGMEFDVSKLSDKIRSSAVILLNGRAVTTK